MTLPVFWHPFHSVEANTIVGPEIRFLDSHFLNHVLKAEQEKSIFHYMFSVFGCLELGFHCIYNGKYTWRKCIIIFQIKDYYQKTMSVCLWPHFG